MGCSLTDTSSSGPRRAGFLDSVSGVSQYTSPARHAVQRVGIGSMSNKDERHVKRRQPGFPLRAPARVRGHECQSSRI